MTRALAVAAAVITVFIYLSEVRCQKYVVPEATVELLTPRGIKIAIPDFVEGISLVAFHVNINEEFETLAHGHYGQDVIKKRDGFWTYNIPLVKVKQGDVIYYWIYAIIEGLGYHGLDRSYHVTQESPHGGTNPLPPLPTITTDRMPDPDDKCRRSSSSHNRRGGLCQDEVLLHKQFDNLDGWTHEIYIGGNQLEDEFTVFTKEARVSSLEHGNLVIQPIMLEEKFNENFVRIGSLNLEGCTSPVSGECHRRGASYLILPPVMSARVTSKNSFTFRYGAVEIRAKLPRGDWIVPELWLEPVNSNLGHNWGRMVLALSRGNIDLATPENNHLLEAGVTMNTTSQFSHLSRDIRWGQDFHTYKLIWTQERLEFSVDGETITTLTAGSGLRPSFFNEEFYITLGVHVAGGRDFPDSMRNKPWKNSHPKRFLKFWEAKETWRPTWDRDSALRVESVKVTAV
uniref:Uncharacterized protein n=1 Tax=Graphocephala atropunctata TaxID=36148 RepID=A0A1B6LTI8_9HEMI